MQPGHIQPGQPQAPDFNGLACVPMAGAKQPFDDKAASLADRRLRELYALSGPLKKDLADIVTDRATGLIYAGLGMNNPIEGQTFISVPSVLLDPNLRNTNVLKVVDKLVADSIEQHHKFNDDVAAAGAADKE